MPVDTESDNVRVVVRCRPMNEKEISSNCGMAVNVEESRGIITVKNPGHGARSGEPPKQFTYDRVFGPDTKQVDVYNDAARPIVNCVLEGYNGTIFAYGQTGTGKTFTMEGVRTAPELRGIIPNSFAHIFGHIAKVAGDVRFLVRVSYLEIYNENVRDLLGKDQNAKLEVKERPDVGVYVKDLSSYVVNNADDLDKTMTLGNKNRSVGATNMNERSSRSHAIFTITVECSEKGPDGQNHVRMGKLHLVDLAGSERQAKTGATGQRLKEATQINLSLSTLGNVISALVDGKSTHIPYRNSKLTRLLQDSLGGNSKTVMIANIGPADYNFDETISTLRYANRAKNIKNKAKINEDPKDALLREFQKEIERLKAQLVEEGSGGEEEGESEEEVEEEGKIVKRKKKHRKKSLIRMKPFCCRKTIRSVSIFTHLSSFFLLSVFFFLSLAMRLVPSLGSSTYPDDIMVYLFLPFIVEAGTWWSCSKMLRSYLGVSTVFCLLVTTLMPIFGSFLLCILRYIPPYLILPNPCLLLFWFMEWMWKKYMPLLFPVLCGHRKVKFTGRSSFPLRVLLLIVDKEIPTEQDFQKVKTYALPYLSDVQRALEERWRRTYYFFAGSIVERFGIPMILQGVGDFASALFGLTPFGPLYTDLDVMFCCSGVKASFSGQDDLLVKPFISGREGFTGYAQLVFSTPSVKVASSTLNVQQANRAVQLMPVDNLPCDTYCFGTTANATMSCSSTGPTMKLCVPRRFETDFTICIHCPEWPPMSDWSSRLRYWPGATDVERIMSLGCHLVAKPAPSDKNKTSWRFSFSLAEVELSKLVPDTARRCFLALKIILKDHLQPVLPKLTSYHIKTIFLNTLEKVPVGFWVEDNIEECFLTLLTELRDALQFRNCPHHWFSSVNLFESEDSCFCINTMNFLPLVKKVERILRDPAPFIVDDGCCCFSPCCCPVLHPIFTRRTIDQLSTDYNEIPFSVDGHGDPPVGDHADQSSPEFSSPRSEAHLHD